MLGTFRSLNFQYDKELANMRVLFVKVSLFNYVPCIIRVLIVTLCNFPDLFPRAIRHPASGYVQGINDLVTPFLVVFLSEYLEGSMDNWSITDLSPEKISNVEADCYWCLSKLLDGMQDHYTFAQPGIQRLVFKLKELVRRIDGNSPLSTINEIYGFVSSNIIFEKFQRTGSEKNS